MLAIFVAVGPVLRVLEGYPVPPKLAAALAISRACSLATAPILWLQFGQVPLLGVLANALVEPVVGVLLGLGLVTACVDLVVPGVGGAARVAERLARGLRRRAAHTRSRPRRSPRSPAGPRR